MKIAKEEMVEKPADIDDKMWAVAGGDPEQKKAILQNKNIYELCKVEPREHETICCGVDTSGNVPKIYVSVRADCLEKYKPIITRPDPKKKGEWQKLEIGDPAEPGTQKFAYLWSDPKKKEDMPNEWISPTWCDYDEAVIKYKILGIFKEKEKEKDDAKREELERRWTS